LRKLGRGDWICITIFLLVINLICLWCVDISVSALLSEGMVTNGFTIGNPMQTYHIGLYGAILCPVLMSFIIVHKIVKEE